MILALFSPVQWHSLTADARLCYHECGYELQTNQFTGRQQLVQCNSPDTDTRILPFIL